MKRFLCVILLGAIALHSFGQKSEIRSLGSFSGIKVAEGIDVYLKKGAKESAKVEVNNADLSDVITEISGSSLKVHMREGSFLRNINAKVYVTYVDLNKITASSAASIYSESEIIANNLEVSASSAAQVELNLNVGTLKINVSSAADVELKGKARSTHIEVSSAGQVDAYDLEAEKVSAEASSAGSAKVNVINDFDANASSGGSIRFRGNPSKSRTNSSSGGSVKKSS